MTNKNNEYNILIIIIVVILVLFLFSGFGMMGFGGMMGNYSFSGMWIFGFLFMALILVALVLFIIWLIKQLQTPVRDRKWKKYTNAKNAILNIKKKNSLKNAKNGAKSINHAILK